MRIPARDRRGGILGRRHCAQGSQTRMPEFEFSRYYSLEPSIIQLLDGSIYIRPYFVVYPPRITLRCTNYAALCRSLRPRATAVVTAHRPCPSLMLRTFFASGARKALLMLFSSRRRIKYFILRLRRASKLCVNNQNIGHGKYNFH